MLSPLMAVAVLLAGSARERVQPVALPPALSYSAFEWKTDFSRQAVPLGEFAAGGPFKDGIPAIDRPRFTRARHTAYLDPREPVIELAVRGDVRAYPLQVLIWHEVVNDSVGGVPVAVTYCPLCNTALAFDRRVDGRELTFGVTGKLRNSNLVMYDRETESWWQQFGGTGLVGHYAGESLRRLPARVVSWRDFRSRHPGGLVLKPPATEFPYGYNPYQGYDNPWTQPHFVYANEGDRRLGPMERVVLVESGDEAVAVPLSTLASRGEVGVRVGGRRLVVRLAGTAASPLHEPRVAAGREIPTAVVLEDGRPVPFDTPFWFAVAAFRPDVRLVR